MPLNSFPFLAFLPVVALIQGLLRKSFGGRWPEIWLLAASLFFYSYDGLAQLPFLIGSILFNWEVARMMSARPAR